MLVIDPAPPLVICVTVAAAEEAKVVTRKTWMTIVVGLASNS